MTRNGVKPPQAPRFPRIVFVLAAWLGAASIAATTGLLARAPIPPPAIAWLLTGAVLLALWLSPGARAQSRSLGPGPLVGFHLTRLLAGAYFLVLYRRGVLPADFALVAGWGDIAVGVGALLVLGFCIPVRTTTRRYSLLLWNAFGLADILLVLGNGIRLFLNDPGLAAPFTTFPLALLPTFVVPLVIVSHIVLFGWYARGSPTMEAARE